MAPDRARPACAAADRPASEAMQPNANRVFISYRRDDTAGYSGRLEEALERRLGRGAVFRDLNDIGPGADCVATIGQRRIDDDRDLVRLEVQVALDAGARVVPVLLAGAVMPSPEHLPAPLKALARRNAVSISDANWDADIGRLVAGFGLPPRRAAWPWALGGAAVAAVAVAAVCALRLAPSADPAERLIGVWQAEVRYDTGDRATERFVFERHAGALTGTAGFLGYPRAIAKLQFDGTNLHFETRSNESMGEATRETTHAYAAELRGRPPDETLAFRMLTTGGFGSHVPVEFAARRVASADAASAP